ncbi:TPA: hypothetical protein ACN1TI_002693, partial [Staphylococcus aureus]
KKEVLHQMIIKLIKINSRKIKLGSNLNVFLLMVSLLTFLFVLTSLFLSYYLRDYFLTILITLFLSQYNIPLFVKSIIDNTFFHYYQSKKAMKRYIIFELIKNNPLLPFLCLFLLIELIFSIYFLDIKVILGVIIGVLLSFNIIVKNFIFNKYIKIINYSSYFLVLMSVLSPNINIISFIVLILFMVFYININNIETNKRECKFTIKNREISIENKEFVFNFLFFKRKNLKTIYITSIIVTIYMFVGEKFNLIIDYTFLIVILYLIEVELISDLNFKRLPKTTAKFYSYNFSPLSPFKKFMLSLYFSYFILYSLILLIVSLLNSYITNFITILNFLLIVPLLLIIGIFYFIGEKITVQSKKKFNNFLSQYFMFIIIILYYSLKKYLFKI